MYQVGRAEHPTSDDPRYDTEAEALQVAKKSAVGDYVIAVWQWIEHEVETVYLVYQGDVWCMDLSHR
jgi:hypothetical protein